MQAKRRGTVPELRLEDSVPVERSVVSDAPPERIPACLAALEHIVHVARAIVSRGKESS